MTAGLSGRRLGTEGKEPASAHQGKTLRKRILWSAIAPPLVMFVAVLVLGTREFGRLTEEATRLRFEVQVDSVATVVLKEIHAVEAAAARIAVTLGTHQVIEESEVSAIVAQSGIPAHMVTRAFVVLEGSDGVTPGVIFKVLADLDTFRVSKAQSISSPLGKTWLDQFDAGTTPGWRLLSEAKETHVHPFQTSRGGRGLVISQVPLDRWRETLPGASEHFFLLIAPHGMVADSAHTFEEAGFPADSAAVSRLVQTLGSQTPGSQVWIDHVLSSWLGRQIKPGWVLASRVDWIESFIPVLKLSTQGLLLLGIMIAGTLLLIRLGTDRLARPILALRDAAVRIAGGERDVHVPTLGEDELGALADAFRTMRDQLALREDELKAEREDQFSNLLGGLSSRYFLYRVDLTGRFQHVGANLDTVLGYNPGGLIGRRPPYLAPESLAEVDRRRRTLIETGGGSALFNVAAEHSNGEARTLECFETPVVDAEGGVLAIEGLARDVTHRVNEAVRVTELLDSVPEAMVIYGASGVTEVVNEPTERLVGVARHKLMGSSVTALIPEEYQFDDGLEALYTLEGPDRDRIDIEISQRRLETGDGVIYIAALRNISAHIETLRRVERSEAMLRGLIDHSNAAIFLKDLSGRFLLVNDHLADILGQPVDEVTGKTDHELYAAEFADPIVENDRDVISSNRARTTEDVIVQNGEPRTFVSVRFPIGDGRGGVSGVGGISTDITEFTRQRDELSERTRQLDRERRVLRGLLDAIPDPVFFKREDGTYAFVNRAFSSFMGRSVAEVEGATDKELYPAPTCAERVRQDQLAIASMHRIRTRMEAASADGQPAIFDAIRVPVTGEDSKIIGVAGFDRNVTAVEKARRSAEVANIAKSTFLANMSHEIRTPMNAILGFSEILKERVDDPDQARLLGSIHDSGKTLLTLINDILDLSKVEAGKLLIEYGVVDLRSLLAETVRMFEPEAEIKNLYLRVEVEDDVPELVLLDEVRLRQVLLNLLSNAIKFTHEGGVSIRASATVPHMKGNHATVRISVSDTGIGIPAAQCDRVFEAFEQRDGQEHRYGGTGLGLAIARNLVLLQNGTLSVVSEEGAGSTFTAEFREVELPSLSDGSPSRSPGRIADRITFAPATVLVVDDMETNRLLVREFLEPRGLNVIEAVDGKQCVEVAEAMRPELILMDLQMPGMSGYEAARILKAHPELASIPIVALTASAMASQEEQAREECDSFLRKPIDGATLVAELGRFLRHRISEEEESAANSAAGRTASETLEGGIDRPDSVIDSLALQAALSEASKTLSRLQTMVDIGALEALGEEVTALGERHAWPKLSEWGRRAADLAGRFELDLLARHLLRLPDFLVVLSDAEGTSVPSGRSG